MSSASCFLVGEKKSLLFSLIKFSFHALLLGGFPADVKYMLILECTDLHNFSASYPISLVCKEKVCFENRSGAVHGLCVKLGLEEQASRDDVIGQRKLIETAIIFVLPKKR